MRICRGRWRGGTCGRGCDLLIHAAAAGTKPEAICTWRSRRSKTPPAERVGRTLPPAWWGTENTPAGSALAMASPENTNVSGSVDDRRNTTRWRSRLRAKGDRGSAEKWGVAASASKPTNASRRVSTRWRSRLRAKGDRGSAEKWGVAASASKPANASRRMSTRWRSRLRTKGDRGSAEKCGVAASASKPTILLSDVDRGVRGWPWRRYSAHGVRRPQRRQIRIFSRRRFELSVDPTRLR